MREGLLGERVDGFIYPDGELWWEIGWPIERETGSFPLRLEALTASEVGLATHGDC
jgi:hypothetical protein